ncbi:uncharacterized protein [Chironomus tepperi]|uniref:uncharacterized protein n=1 Tax=Chironomus tepperi TaxID=113505 RepID=UPI00391F5289
MVAVNSCEAYFTAQKPDLLNHFPTKLKFIFLVENCELDFIRFGIDRLIVSKKIGPRYAAIDWYEVLFIIETNFVHLGAIEYFTDEACNEPQVILLNSFNRATQKWNKKLENHEHFQNFYGCPLKLGFVTEQLGTCWADYSDNKILKIGGIITELFKMSSIKLNFQPMSDVLIANDSDASIFLARYSKFIFEHHSTVTFSADQDVIIATPGELYTSYEKLLLPFDSATWKYLHITFVACFVAIFAIKRMPKFFRQRIFGDDVKTPVLNVISTFFGISQFKLPIRHMPRFILTLFIFFCLIFRTCYQSKLFEFMTSEPRRPPPMTIEDLKNRNYTVLTDYDPDIFYTLLNDEIMDWPNVSFRNSKEILTLMWSQAQNSSAKIAMIVSVNALNLAYSRYKVKWHVLPDYIHHTANYGTMMLKNNYLYTSINKVTQQCIPAGILDFMITNCKNSRKYKVTDKNWAILQFNNLEFGFVIWFGCCLVCICAFLWEIVIGIVKLTSNSSIYQLSRLRHRKLQFAKIHPGSLESDREETPTDLDEIRMLNLS